MKETLRQAGIAGIFALAFYTPALILDILVIRQQLPATLVPLYLTVYTFSMISFVMLYCGFLFFSTKIKNLRLHQATHLLIFTLILWFGYNIITLLTVAHNQGLTYANMLVGSFIMILFGAANIFFGMKMLHLRKHYGDLAKTAGTLHLAIGASFITVLFSPVGVVLLIPAAIFEILLVLTMKK